MKYYHYYVTFVNLNNAINFGSIEHLSESKIDTFEAIHSMRREIEAKAQLTNICILDYKLIRDEPY